MCSIELRQCWHANDAHRCCCSRFRERILLFSASSGRSRERNFAASSVSCCRVDCLQPVAKPPEISLVGLFFFCIKNQISQPETDSRLFTTKPQVIRCRYTIQLIIFSVYRTLVRTLRRHSNAYLVTNLSFLIRSIFLTKTNCSCYFFRFISIILIIHF